MTFKGKLNTISSMLYPILKSFLFSLPAEVAHDLTLKTAALSPTLGKLTGISPDHKFDIRVGKNIWQFPLGLAAGLDKNAEALPFFEAQGFGAVECGTITLKPQLGNDKPRMFRYPDELSLRNAMGFPNHGVAKTWPRLHAFERKIPIGANIGKNKDSDRGESIEELTLLFESLREFVDYFVINVSSPNTPGLRAFQEKSYLAELFTELNLLRGQDGPDLFLKIAPDLEREKILDLAQISSDHKLTGIIATNTTIIPEMGIGGVSGVLLQDKAKKVHKTILEGNFPLELIGVGGVSQFEDLLDFWMNGGKVMQIYTSYVYQGPEILKRFQKELYRFLKFQNLFSLEIFLGLDLLEKQKRIQDFKKSNPRTAQI